MLMYGENVNSSLIGGAVFKSAVYARCYRGLLRVRAGVYLGEISSLHETATVKFNVRLYEIN